MNRLMLKLMARSGYMNEAEDGNDLGASDAFEDLLSPVAEEDNYTSESGDEGSEDLEVNAKEGAEETEVAGDEGEESDDAKNDAESNAEGEGGSDENKEDDAAEGGTGELGSNGEEVQGEASREVQAKNQGEGLSEEEKQAKYQEWRENLEESFAISEDDANLLVTEPESVLPRLAVNVYERVVQDVMSGIQNLVPQMIQANQVQVEQANKMRNEFYRVNPGLEGQDDNQIQELITSYLPLVKQQFKNSNLTQEELIRKVGMTIGASLGVDAGKTKEVTPKPKPSAQPAPPPAAPARQSGATEPPGLEGQNDFLNELISSQE